MAGGGGDTKTTSEPWKAAQPYLQSILQRASGLSQQTPAYYPGATTVGSLPSEQRGWDQLFQANNQTFGQGGAYENAGGALTNQLTGNTSLGNMANRLSGPATQGLISGIQQGPGQVGRYGFNTQLNPYGMAPQFGQAGGLDARGALQSALSGQPDYSGAQANIDAANAPLLHQFNNEVLPGLNSKATFLNNGTGGIKALGNILPELGSRMQQNATGVLEGERQRALGAQQNAAQLVSQGGLQSYGLGLQGAMDQAGLQQNLAQHNLQTDTTNAGLRQDQIGNWLNFGSLAGQLGGQAGQQQLNAIGQFPGYAQAGQQPAQDQLAYGAYQRGLAQQQLQAQMDRFNYSANAPRNNLNWYANLAYPTAGFGGTGTQSNPQGGGSQLAGAAGGALSGAAAGSMIMPGIGTGIGALLGGLGGYFGG